MITVKIDGVDSVREMLGDLQYKLPSVLARAVTETAKDAQRGVKDWMPKQLDRPTPFIMQSVRVVAADKNKPRIESAVGFSYFRKNEDMESFWAPMSMRPQISGGGRKPKASERTLISAGIMKPGQFLVPAKGAPRDKYGNVPASFMNKVLFTGVASGSASQGFSSPLSRTARSRSAKSSRYFVHPSGKGIYEAVGNQPPMPVFLFVNKVNYQKRLMFDAIVNGVVDRRLQFHIDESIGVVMRKYGG